MRGLWGLVLVACGPADPGSPAEEIATDAAPAGVFRVRGRAPAAGAGRAGAGTITDVLAVNPAASSPERRLAPVAANGAFTLDLEPGRPWVLVFVDRTATGVDMIVGVLRAEGLDTLTPIGDAAGLDLGDVAVGADGTAAAGIAWSDLIAALGLDDATATWLAAVDDLSLRYANPDIDDDGVIDVEQDHRFQLDLHLRAAAAVGGRRATIADFTGDFLPSDVTFDWELSSVYALWDAAWDGGDYVTWGPEGSALVGGAGFAATHTDGTAAPAPSSYSPLRFGDQAGFGPDYALHAGIELPGSGGSPARLVWTLPSATLTFDRVVTRTVASLTEIGVLAPFIRLDVNATGAITGVSWEWRRSAATGWVPATAAEVGAIVGDRGGYVSMHRLAHGREIGVPIPASPSGTVPWTEANVHLRDVSTAEFLNTTAADLCDVAVSYDDQLGLRLFAGGASSAGGCGG